MKLSKKVIQARELAMKYHAWQKYWEHDYLYHLDAVAEVAVSVKLPEDYIVACYLHDIIEDTSCKFWEITEMFGEFVCNLVYACTDELGRDKSERKSKTYDKLEGMQKWVLVKLCDRIANCTFSANNSKRKALWYLEDNVKFRKIRNPYPFSCINSDNLNWKYDKLWEMYNESLENIRKSLTK